MSSDGLKSNEMDKDDEEKKSDEKKMDEEDDDGDEEKKMDLGPGGKDSLVANPAINEMEMIREMVSKEQAMITEHRPLDTLRSLFKDHANYTRQLKNLIGMEIHSSYRQLRGDGNCFYRAFLLGLFETVEANLANGTGLKILERVTETVQTSCERICKHGYERLTIEDFFDAFMDELAYFQGVASGSGMYDGNGKTAFERLSREGHSNYLIYWMRMLTSLEIIENESHYKPFLQDESVGKFIKSRVEAVHSEADHPMIIALARATKVPIRVYMFENIDKGGPQVLTVPESEEPLFDLIFRPGHYDCLYRKTKES